MPPWDQGCRWWSSHQAKARWQPSAAQVSCLRPTAIRWACEKSRDSRPRSRATERLSRTAGRMPAPQARRRASPAEICLAGVEVGGLQGPGQDGVVDGDHDGGGGPGVQVLGGQVLEERGEGESAAVVPVESFSALTHPPWGGHRVEDLAQERRRRGGDGEVSGGGAVVVVVQAQRAPRPGDLLLACDQVVLVGVDPGLVGLDGLDRRVARGGGAGRGRTAAPSRPGRPRPSDAGQDSPRRGAVRAARTITAAWAGRAALRRGPRRSRRGRSRGRWRARRLVRRWPGRCGSAGRPRRWCR